MVDGKDGPKWVLVRYDDLEKVGKFVTRSGNVGSVQYTARSGIEVKIVEWK